MNIVRTRVNSVSISAYVDVVVILQLVGSERVTRSENLRKTVLSDSDMFYFRYYIYVNSASTSTLF